MKKMRFLTVAAALTLLISQVVHASSDVVYSWQSSGKSIALTFDDGPHPRYTEEIIDILDEYGIRATFFFIGVNVEAYPEEARLVESRGHEIGNHTYSHKNLRDLSYSDTCNEIDFGEGAVLEATGYKTNLLRPPEGKMSDTLLAATEERQYNVICWSVDTLDWAHTPTEQIVENVLSSTEAGDIILFHDFVSGQSPTPAALRQIIPVLLERGYEFVTVSELLCGK
ncbi:MAG: hypothetical protein E7627_02310 [Ruminococcaceae bacterium]|nr:hypothetical protein [Oscillospiraceae bacterium]